MVVIKPSQLRNIGIIAHINAGKTTTTERILYHAGSTETVGDVDRGNTITDYLIQERDRGITITSAAVSFDWKKHRVNLIDTPGHVDFTMEVERSLSVLDGAVTILDSSAGVEAQTITVWNQAAKYKIPNIIFLNKYDKPMADYEICLKGIKAHLGIDASLIQLPVKTKDSLSILDIVGRKHIYWTEPSADHGSKFITSDLSESKNIDKRCCDIVEEEREKLINRLTDIDDTLASHVIECDKISQVSGTLLADAIRKATIACKLSPVLVGSSFKYIGVQQLMDAITGYLPSPVDREKQILGSIEGDNKIELQASKGFCGFIFKITHDKRLGAISYTKLCNGSVSKLERVLNLESGRQDQVKRVYRVFADEVKEITGDEVIEKYDIVALTGLSESRTGDIIVGQNFKLETTTNVTGLPFQLVNKSTLVPQINRLEAVYYCSIESRSISQQVKLEQALACMSREDPSFTFDIDERGITTVRGMGKLHLEIVRDRLESEHKIDSLLGPLQIAYRETILESALEELTVDRLVNGTKNSLEIKLQVGPKPRAGQWKRKQLRLDTSNSENSLLYLRGDQRKAIESGLASALSHGPSMGLPLIDCDILLLDFKANRRCGLPIISSAASQCLTQAIQRCSPVLLEPIMLLEVVAPAEFNGSILGNISTRRGTILSTEARANGMIVIRSTIPLSSMSDYSEFLRITSSGRASFTMELHTYCAMSESDKQALLKLG